MRKISTIAVVAGVLLFTGSAIASSPRSSKQIIHNQKNAQMNQRTINYKSFTKSSEEKTLEEITAEHTSRRLERVAKRQQEAQERESAMRQQGQQTLSRSSMQVGQFKKQPRR